DIGLADIDVTHLLIDPSLGNRLLDVGIDLIDRDVGSRTHLACRLRVGGLGVERGRERDQATDCNEYRRSFHANLPISRRRVRDCWQIWPMIQAELAWCCPTA